MELRLGPIKADIPYNSKTPVARRDYFITAGSQDLL